ncbi:10146_t:CDS:2, partial [Gigaspora margarita]
IIVGAKNDTFENHVNDFFEYAVKKTPSSKNDPFYEVKQYLDEQIATRTTNIFECIASKQAFSCAGCIIDKSCTLLDPDTVTILMCQRN